MGLAETGSVKTKTYQGKAMAGFMDTKSLHGYPQLPSMQEIDDEYYRDITMPVKQVIVIRKDLKMRRGKECAQAAHASMKWLVDKYYHQKSNKLSQAQEEWLQGSFTKVCVRVNSEQELLEVYQKALDNKLEAHLIKDAGKTEFNEPTLTCCAIGPDYDDKVDHVTGDLTLY